MKAWSNDFLANRHSVLSMRYFESSNESIRPRDWWLIRLASTKLVDFLITWMFVRFVRVPSKFRHVDLTLKSLFVMEHVG